MNTNDLFNAGTTPGALPKGDVARQAVDSLRGYAYQALAAALAWLDIDERSRLYLEVAEDYAIIAEQALSAIQVKDTERSGSVTLNSESVRNAVTAFVDLVNRNPMIQVELRFFTTSKIGTEKKFAERSAGVAGLKYWRKVAGGAAASPLRKILESDKFPESVRAFCTTRDDATLRRDLFTRLHWDCGKPDFSTLRQELEARLVVIGRDRFRLPALEARRLANHLVYQVLEKSTVKQTEARVLTRSKLYELIDSATQMSVPRFAIDALARLGSDLNVSLSGGLGAKNLLSIGQTGWFIEGTTLPVAQGMIARNSVESAVTASLGDCSACVLVGSSGLGKSIVSRAVAIARTNPFFIVDFRDTTMNESGHQLDMLFARIGGLPPSLLILEDLNHLDKPHVVLSLARVIEASRRHDHEVLITCYRKPSLTALAEVGLTPGCIVDCPYFSEEEVHALVIYNGGDPGRWGRLAYMAGASGHPQLTHAFATGIAARGWPIKERKDILDSGLSSRDITAAREAARRRLVSALPEGTRNLLYRLSLAIGHFDRSLALAIGEIPPAVVQTGERLDQLVGPWLESAGKDLFRVSPLASRFGTEMLTRDKQKSIHQAIATQMLGKHKIDASNFDAIMIHAIKGKSPNSLIMLANSVLSSDYPVLKGLAEHLSVFRFFRTDVRIYPDSASVSGMLRLGQYKLAVAAGEEGTISDIATALFNEIRDLPEGESKRILEVPALSLVLTTMGVANHLDNWIALLLRLRTLVEANDYVQRLAANADDGFDAIRSNFLGALFSIGSANLASVDRLENIINELDELDPKVRAILLVPVMEVPPDYSSLINGTWTTQLRRGHFDAKDAAIRYRRMAAKTRNWSIRSISVQCSVAQAVITDEYLDDREGALELLEEAVQTLGQDLILSRAKARVHWNRGEHASALKIFRGIADQFGLDNPVERAFAMRDAAISAAKCDDWPQAEKWFLDAQSAARLAQIGDMDIMAIGLGADSAVAALEAGDIGQAVTGVAEAVEALTEVDPESTLPAAYCHRIIRHTVLWMQSRTKGSDVKLEGQSFTMEAGTCSNPNPLPAIRDHPLGHIDFIWYMLAEMEIAAGIDLGIVASLENRLKEGSIPVMEVQLRMEMIQADIDRLDAAGFAAHFTPYVETFVYLKKERVRLHKEFDPLSPERGQVPPLVKQVPFDPVAEQVAKDAILAYGIRSALARRAESMPELETALNVQTSGPFPGQFVFHHQNRKPDSLNELDQIALTIINNLLRREYVEPKEFWMAGARFFEWINHSDFKRLLTTHLAAWQKCGWRQILKTESFQLSRPRQTVPQIEEILTKSTDDQTFVAKLLLATSEALDVSLSAADRDTLQTMAEAAE